MGLSAIDLLIGLAGGAEARLNSFYEPEGKAFLLFTCPFAEKTFKTLFGLTAVLIGNGIVLHNFFPVKLKPEYIEIAASPRIY